MEEISSFSIWNYEKSRRGSDLEFTHVCDWLRVITVPNCQNAVAREADNYDPTSIAVPMNNSRGVVALKGRFEIRDGLRLLHSVATTG